MRELSALLITDTVARMCIEANYHLSLDVKQRICEFCERESWVCAKEILEHIVENYEIADRDRKSVV